jgi:hypothetical protein
MVRDCPYLSDDQAIEASRRTPASTYRSYSPPTWVAVDGRTSDGLEVELLLSPPEAAALTEARAQGLGLGLGLGLGRRTRQATYVSGNAVAFNTFNFSPRELTRLGVPEYAISRLVSHSKRPSRTA